MPTRDATAILAGRYALERELGRSDTGLVWRAEDLLLGRTVAVKLVHPRLGDDPRFARRLELEARKIASLSAPGVARLLDTGEEDGVPFLVREHVEGTSATAVLAASGPLAPAEAARIAADVLDALIPVHQAGVLHLHLELDDVLLEGDGHVRVTDLGIGAAVTATFEPAEAAALLGGAGLAPEQRAGGTPDARTDVFAVGALLFTLLTGEAPQQRRLPSAIRPDVPRALDRVVVRALAPDPGQRFASVAEFAAALRETGVAEPPAEGGSIRGGWRGWLLVPILVAVVAAAVIGAGLWLGRLEVGGPLGIRPADDHASPTPARTQGASGAPAIAATIRPVSVQVFDPPPGDGSENDSTAPLAIDGDPATAWRSENYFDGLLHKDGVGLIFDLGSPRAVSGFALSTPYPGFAFQVAIGDDPDALLAEVGPPATAELVTRGALTGSGQYVLVWITSVVPVPDANRAEIAEFAMVGAPDA